MAGHDPTAEHFADEEAIWRAVETAEMNERIPGIVHASADFNPSETDFLTTIDQTLVQGLGTISLITKEGE